MTPHCTICGHDRVNIEDEVVTPHCIERRWGCERGHKFVTMEVPPTFLASAPVRASALNTLFKRIKLWHRDQLIRMQHKQSGHSLALLARNHNLTKARVAQILK